jgi:hypothetical protein
VIRYSSGKGTADVTTASKSFGANGATPALALCAASLRARAKEAS